MVIKLWKLKKHIVPQIKLHLLREHYGNIEEMFSEIYVINEEGNEFLCFRVNGEDNNCDICLMFYAINGAFYDTGQWSYVKRRGVRIQ